MERDWPAERRRHVQRHGRHAMTDIVNGLLVRGRQILMARRSPSRRNYPDSWSFPGGHVEHGETLEQALKRELLEEIGVQAKSWSFIQRFDDRSVDPDRPVTFHCFAVDEWVGDPTNRGREHSEIRWVDLADAPGMRGLAFPSYRELFEALAVDRPRD